MNRRGFLKSMAIGSGTAILGGAGQGSLAQAWATGAADDKPADAYGGLTVGAQSYCFRNFDREQALKKIQELGLNHVEFYQKHAPLDSTPEQIKAILNLCKEYQITPVAYGVQGFT